MHPFCRLSTPTVTHTLALHAPSLSPFRFGRPARLKMPQPSQWTAHTPASSCGRDEARNTRPVKSQQKHQVTHPRFFATGSNRCETAGPGRQKPVEQRPRQSCSFAFALVQLVHCIWVLFNLIFHKVPLFPLSLFLLRPRPLTR